jgi:hypothetical protein
MKSKSIPIFKSDKNQNHSPNSDLKIMILKSRNNFDFDPKKTDTERLGQVGQALD